MIIKHFTIKLLEKRELPSICSSIITSQKHLKSCLHASTFRFIFSPFYLQKMERKKWKKVELRENLPKLARFMDRKVINLWISLLDLCSTYDNCIE